VQETETSFLNNSEKAVSPWCLQARILYLHFDMRARAFGRANLRLSEVTFGGMLCRAAGHRWLHDTPMTRLGRGQLEKHVLKCPGRQAERLSDALLHLFAVPQS
jgi:hypothetical protein